jgi:hypothetical protein
MQATLETSQPRRVLVLFACDCVFTVECECQETLALLESVFVALVRPAMPDVRPLHCYGIDGPDASGGFVVSDGTRISSSCMPPRLPSTGAWW